METVDRRALPTVPTAPTAATAAVSILQRFPNSTPKGDTFQLNTTSALTQDASKTKPHWPGMVILRRARVASWSNGLAIDC